jgi:hypothetical protein
VRVGEEKKAVSELNKSIDLYEAIQLSSAAKEIDRPETSRAPTSTQKSRANEEKGHRLSIMRSVATG